MTLDESNEKDNRLSLNGIELLAEETLNPYLDGQMIDYVSSARGEGFVISQERGSSCA